VVGSRASGVVGADALGGRDRRDHFLNPGRKRVGLRAQPVDLAKQDGGQLTMVIIETDLRPPALAVSGHLA